MSSSLSILKNQLLSSSSSSSLSINEILIILCDVIENHDNNNCSSNNITKIIIRKLRSKLCPHTIDLPNAIKWDYYYYYILKNCIFPSYPKMSWQRLCKQIMILDLKHTSPYDGSHGFVKNLMNICLELIDNISNNNVRKSLQLIRCEFELINITTTIEESNIIQIPSLLHITTSYPITWGLLHHAASLIIPSNEIISMLIKEGLSLGSKDSIGCSPLHVACRVINLSTIIHLINYGANIKDIDNEGKTPLMTLLLAIAKRTYTNNRQINSELLCKCITILIGDPSTIWNQNTNKFEHVLVLAVAYTDEFVAETIIKIAYGSPSKWNRDILHRVIFFTTKNKRIKVVELIFEYFGEYIFKDFDIVRCLNQGIEPTMTISHQHFTDYSEYNFIQILYKESILLESVQLIKILIGDYKKNPCGLLHILYMSICFGSLTALHTIVECADLSPFLMKTAEGVSRLFIFSLTPLSLAAHTGNLQIAKFLVSSSKYRLKARDVLRIDVNPIISCVLGNNYECLSYLAGHMGKKQFSIACWQKDYFGNLPLQVLLKLAVKVDSFHKEEKTLFPSARRLYFDNKIIENTKTIKIMNLICDMDTPTVGLQSYKRDTSEGGRYAVWSKRVHNLQSKLNETNEKVHAIFDKLGMTDADGEACLLYGKEIQWMRYQRWKEVLFLINSSEFVSKMQTLVRSSAFDQNWDTLAQCVLLAIGESANGLDQRNANKFSSWAKLVKHLGGHSKQSSDRMFHLITQLKTFAYPFTDNKGIVIDENTLSQVMSLHSSNAINKKNYFNELKSLALRKGNHIGTGVEYGLTVLKMWIDVVILDGNLMHGSSHDFTFNDRVISARDALSLSELLDYRSRLDNVITSIFTLINASNEDKAATSYQSLIDIIIRSENSTFEEKFTETYLNFNVQGYISSMIPSTKNIDKSICDSNKAYAITDDLSMKFKEDMVTLLTDRRKVLNKLLAVADVGADEIFECPLLRLCAKGMWSAAQNLLHAWISDGYDISKSLYIVNGVMHDGSALASCERHLFSANYSDLWSSVDVSEISIITPLSLAVYSRQTNFVSTFLSSYPHFKVSTDLMDFCLRVGYTEMILLLATRINLFHASSRMVSSANIDEKPQDYRTNTKYNPYHTAKAPVTLAKQMSSIMSNAMDEALSIVEAIKPANVYTHLSGPYRGLFTSLSSNSDPSSSIHDEVLMMDGSKVPLQVLRKDLYTLRRALPIPLYGIGINSSGITILHKSKASMSLNEGLDSGENICQLLFDAGSWRTLTVDRNGKYPVYNVLCNGDVKLAVQMLSRAISLQRGAPLNIEDFHILHTVIPISMDVKRLFLLPAVNEYDGLVIHQEQMLACENLHPLQYPTKSALIFAKLKKKKTWEKLLQVDFSPLIQISLSQSGCTIDSVIRARRVLTLLGIPFLQAHTPSRISDLASLEERKERNKLVKLIDHSDFTVDSDVNWNIFIQLKELLLGWLRNHNPSSQSDPKPNNILESMFLFHNFQCSFQDIGVKGYKKAFDGKVSRHQYMYEYDEKENSASLHDRLVFETKIQYKGIGTMMSSNPRFETAATTNTSLINHLNLSLSIMETWRREELVDLEKALELSYSILDFARWMVVEKMMQVSLKEDHSSSSADFCNQFAKAESNMSNFKSKFEDQDGSMFYSSGLASKITICETLVAEDLQLVLDPTTEEGGGTDALDEIKELLVEGLAAVMRIKGDSDLMNRFSNIMKGEGKGEGEVKSSSSSSRLDDLRVIIKSLNETRISSTLATLDALDTDITDAAFKRMDGVLARLDEVLVASGGDGGDGGLLLTPLTKTSKTTLLGVASMLKDFFGALSYLNKHGQNIYKSDVHNWINKASSWNPLVPLMIPPSLIKYKEKTTDLLGHLNANPNPYHHHHHHHHSTPFTGDLWESLSKEDEDDRIVCCELLLGIGVSPSVGTNHDSNAVALAATFGYDGVLKTILTFEPPCPSTILSANKYLIWYVLYGMTLSSIDERLKRNKLNKAHHRCLQLLLEHDFPVMQPHTAKTSCADLAILKKVDPTLVNVIILKEQLSYANLIDSDDDSNHDDDDDDGANETSDMDEKRLLFCISPEAPDDVLDMLPAGRALDQYSLEVVSNTLRFAFEEQDVYVHFVMSQLFHLDFQYEKNAKWWSICSQAIEKSVKARTSLILEETFKYFFPCSKTRDYCPIRVMFSNAMKSNSSIADGVDWYPIYSVLSSGNTILFHKLVELYLDDISTHMEVIASLVLYSTFYDNEDALSLVLSRLSMLNVSIWDRDYYFPPVGDNTSAAAVAVLFSPRCLRCLVNHGAPVSLGELIHGLQKGLLDDSTAAATLKYINKDSSCNQLLSDPYEDDEHYTTLLHLACRRGHVEVVRYLISIKASVCLDSRGFLPIHYSIACGHGKITKLLIVSSFFLRRALKTLFHYSRSFLVSRSSRAQRRQK